MTEAISLDRYTAALEEVDSLQFSGVVTELIGLLIKSTGPHAAIGDLCEIELAPDRTARAKVIGFREGSVLSMALEEVDGLRPGCRIVARPSHASIPVGPGLLGRVLDGLGRPLDGGPKIIPSEMRRLQSPPPNPLEREHITEALVTGVRAIDGLLTCGKGQRIGIFGGSGVGKSTLLGALSKNNFADVSVVALIGERNREVLEFIDHELGPEGLRRSVVIVATSDQPAPVRVQAAFVAQAIAEYFRDEGNDVLLVMDSVTRFAMAQREIGLAAGEPPSQKGYTPSVFNLLPKVFEGAGRFRRGSITGFYTVLVEGDDFNEPICDAVRSILDGHVVLSRKLGARGHYPAIDILNSVSRLAPKVATKDQKDAAQRVREALAEYSRAEDLIQLGAYISGSNPQLDASIRVLPEITDFLRQPPEDKVPLDETVAEMQRLRQQLSLTRAATA